MFKQEDTEKIERYIKGESGDNERSDVESMFLDGEENIDLKNHLKKDWDSMPFESSCSEADLERLLDRVHHIIRKRERKRSPKPLQKVMLVYMKAAAVFFIPLLVGGGLLYRYFDRNIKGSNRQEVTSTIYAPLGSRVVFNLPDSTTGMLNSGSRLSYSIPFIGKRKVKLEGEAWFEVKHDSAHPFEINAGTSKVTVLGTSLNVSAYPAENYIEVVLQKGKVEFHDELISRKITMLPSERLVFRDGQIEKSITDPSKYNAWTEGKLVFRGDPMAEVARRIERWYNVKVNLADKQLEKYSFRATFLDDSLEEVLHFLSLTSPIRYTITPREQQKDGTFSKAVVTFYLK